MREPTECVAGPRETRQAVCVLAAPKGNDNPPPQGMWLAENLTPPGTHAGDVNVGDVDGNPTRRGWYVVCVHDPKGPRAWEKSRPKTRATKGGLRDGGRKSKTVPVVVCNELTKKKQGVTGETPPIHPVPYG